MELKSEKLAVSKRQKVPCPERTDVLPCQMKSIINQSRSISSIQCLQYNAADKYSGSGSVHEYFLVQMCLYSAGDSFLKSPSLPQKSNGAPLSDI